MSDSSDTVYCMNHPVFVAVNGNPRKPLCAICQESLADCKAKIASNSSETTAKDGTKVRQHKDSEGNTLTIMTDSEGNVSVSHAPSADSRPAYLGENDFGPEKIPAMILIRGKSPEECQGKARRFKMSLREVRVDYLPRAKRNRYDAKRAASPDLIVGPLTMDLDPEPYAAWIPLDFEDQKKDRRAQFEKHRPERLTLLKEKFVYVFRDPVETPPDRCNPTLWSEQDFNGAEVIDLRNYPDVLRANQEFIRNSIKDARGWQGALRNASAARNQRPIWATLPESNVMRWEVRDAALGIAKLPYKPGKIGVYRNPEFDHGPRRNVNN